MLKSLAAEGRTVFVSSHLMSEMALTATHLIVIGRGRLIADTSVDEFIARSSRKSVTVTSPEATQLREQLLGPDIEVTSTGRNLLQVRGLTAEQIGTIAWRSHLPLFELTAQQASLEEAFIEMTHESVEYRSTDPAAVPA
jgi:ABC-2 type transport system ATP-binding protein